MVWKCLGQRSLEATLNRGFNLSDKKKKKITKIATKSPKHQIPQKAD